MDQKLVDKINNRIEEGTLRSLSHFEGFSDFFSNDYLGLSKVSSPTEEGSFGATGSRLISGNNQLMQSSEKSIANFFNAPSGVMFNSGFDANIGLFSSVPQRGDTVLFDEFIHASVRDGIRLSFAACRSFKHNSLEDLELQLNRAVGTVYVAIEGLYSMDGDVAPLRSIADLCVKYSAFLIVDEAHSAGIFGEDGKGLVSALKLENKVFARLVTFGKAYGSHGGCVIGSKELTQYLVNYARSFIYTTALPGYVYERNDKIIRIDDLNERRNNLQLNLEYFRTNFKHPGLISEVNSPIQILQVGDVKETVRLAEELQKEKLAVKPIFSPTIKKGKERLRICIHSFNTVQEIDQLVSTLSR